MVEVITGRVRATVIFIPSTWYADFPSARIEREVANAVAWGRGRIDIPDEKGIRHTLDLQEEGLDTVNTSKGVAIVQIEVSDMKHSVRHNLSLNPMFNEA
jgi:hypothetical protein